MLLLFCCCKELNGQINHMVTESQKKKRQLDHQHTETQMTQVCGVLDRIRSSSKGRRTLTLRVHTGINRIGCLLLRSLLFGVPISLSGCSPFHICLCIAHVLSSGLWKQSLRRTGGFSHIPFASILCWSP